MSQADSARATSATTGCCAASRSSAASRTASCAPSPSNHRRSSARRCTPRSAGCPGARAGGRARPRAADVRAPPARAERTAGCASIYRSPRSAHARVAPGRAQRSRSRAQRRRPLGRLTTHRRNTPSRLPSSPGGAPLPRRSVVRPRQGEGPRFAPLGSAARGGIHSRKYERDGVLGLMGFVLGGWDTTAGTCSVSS